MKKNSQLILALMTAVISIGCGPNDNKGSMNQDNSNKEGAVDTTRIPNFDSAHASDSSHASLSSPHLTAPSGNTSKVKPAHL